MWRFILVTFGFLGFAFYELSGGADYAPGENSLQARAKNDTSATPATTAQTSKSAEIVSVEELRTTRLNQLQTTKEDRFGITLASVDTDSFKTERVRTLPRDEDKVALLTESEDTDAVDAAVAAALGTETGDVAGAKKIWPGAIELFSLTQERQRAVTAARETPTPTAYEDIRYVTGNVVNMRGGPGTGFERITSLTEGTEVAVLEQNQDGWLKLRVTETGEEGWMADWLVSAPAN
ncbi:SH3 domain-containing protein [Roseovarius aestuariivivens]|uniref:SH3 domain-containing protein n=1 Tax=Roseovarius aestuariivivens TaxID=1888910 RepID=UPI001AEC1A6A|nr:SH3 domain-containing protein [Roseovarius aestuariivivens]